MCRPRQETSILRTKQNKEVRGEWWWFFPITGLSITDPAAHLAVPLFPNATLLSKRAMNSLVNGRTADIHPEVRDHWTNIAADSFVGVRKIVTTGRAEAEAQLAELRFRQIASALTIFTLTRSNYRATCAPTDVVSNKVFNSIALSNNGQWQGRFAIRAPVSLRRNLEELSLEQLLHEMQTHRFPLLLRMLTEDTDVVHESIKVSLRTAALRLCNAIYAGLPGDITLSAIAAFEILVEVGNVQDASVRERIDVLARFEPWKIDRLYAARNKWVHKAEVPTEEEVTDAIIIPLFAMEYLAELVINLAPANTTQYALIQWLDLHAFVRKKNRILPGALRELSSRLSQFDPFEIADRVGRPVRVGCFAVTHDSALLPTWIYSKTEGNCVPIAPLKEIDIRTARVLATALRAAMDNAEQQEHDIEATEGDSLEELCSSDGEDFSSFQRRTAYGSITKDDNHYHICVLGRSKNGKWNLTTAFRKDLPVHEGLKAAAEVLHEHLLKSVDSIATKRAVE